MSEPVLAITDRRYPRPSGQDPRRIGLGGQSYEGFQPPLYCLLAAPVFALAGDYEVKVYALRVLDVVLLLVPVALLVAAGVALGRRPALLRTGRAALLGLPLVLGVAEIVATMMLANWDIFLPRYLYAAILALALLACWAWQQRSRGDGALDWVVLAATRLL